MDQQEINTALERLVDGQTIRVTVASGRVFDGVYDGEQSSLENGLYFETMEGQPLFAHWDKIDRLDYRSARLSAGKMMVPPEHPLSGQHPSRVRADGVPLKPHTARNR